MSILSGVTDWASDAKDKVTSTVKNATNSIGSWLNDTYNNAKTASVISTPSKSVSSSSASSAKNAGYTSSANTNNATNAVYNSANNTSKISNLYDSTKTTTKTPTQYSSLKAYETDKAKTTATENIQKSLNTLGYKYGDEGELKIDGDFGVKTQTNWDNFISDLGVENYLAGIGDKIGSAYSGVKDWLGENEKTDIAKVGVGTSLNALGLYPIGAAIANDGRMGINARNTGETYTSGIQGNFFWLGASLGTAVDPDGDRALIVSGTAGGGTPNASVGLYNGASNAKDVSHLSAPWYNPSLTIGGSAGMPVGATIGYDYNIAKFDGDNEYDPYIIHSQDINAGIGAKWLTAPVEMHGGATFTGVITKEMVYDKIIELLSKENN
ncbi:MAG: hypothetical protein R3Y32_09225 [Bacillota bacterium]